MATYGEPNYKFPTLARAVPNVTTGGTIMATVDVERLTEIAHHHLDCSVCREILREIPSFFGMFFIDWHKAMWDDQANMRPW